MDGGGDKYGCKNSANELSSGGGECIDDGVAGGKSVSDDKDGGKIHPIKWLLMV